MQEIDHGLVVDASILKNNGICIIPIGRYACLKFYLQFATAPAFVAMKAGLGRFYLILVLL
jgi:hypothetical protein